MIQFNLLPDVKIEYVKATRTKRMVTGIALIITAVTCAVFLLLAGVAYGIQKKNMNDLSKDIASKTQELKDTPDLDKVLTIQNQLGALNGLHDQKFVTTRVFDFIQQFTPTGITISDYTADFAANTMTITGNAPSLDRVNVFTDTLKFSKYAVGNATTTDSSQKAFSSVVLSQFSKQDAATSYTINLTFDPAIFNSADKVTLIVPKGTTTNSSIGLPTFKQATQTQEGN